MLPGEAEAADQIARRHCRAMDAMTKLHDVAVQMLIEAPWLGRKRGSSPVVDWTVAGLFTKAIKTFRAIQVLCERGLTEDATALIRILYETHAAIAFILQRNSKERADMYHAYAAMQDRKMVEHWMRTRGLKRKATKRHVETSQKLVDHWGSFLRVALDDVKRHWSGKGSLEATAKALRGEVLYATVYRHGSASVHATDFGAYVQANRKSGTLVIALNPSPENVNGVAAVSREILWLTASRIDQRFKFGFDRCLRPLKVKKRDVPR